LPANKALDVFWDKRMREAGKMVRPSPLFPLSQRRTGKAQSIWTSTTDLMRHWPVSLLIWGAVAGGVPAVATAFWYANAYAPASVSKSHAQTQLTISPAIASRANANSCTNCHALSGKLTARCDNCHHTDSFNPTIIKPHADAGITCADCHPEHRGSDFRSGEAALFACTQCHTDANKQTYRGRSVHAPHSGSFGYPVVNGKWVWPGFDDSEWALKKIALKRMPSDSDEEWRRKQFHAIHQLRVRAAPGMIADVQGQLWCSSCHRTLSPVADREMPRTTCGFCHNGRTEEETGRVLITADKPNCTSCHVQHATDRRHWGSSWLSTGISER
jgi:formate-dependent nitrite reductase cytochrome c552 subunit